MSYAEFGSGSTGTGAQIQYDYNNTFTSGKKKFSV
jgi:hypothetical protein